jgi:hypothetical protein
MRETPPHGSAANAEARPRTTRRPWMNTDQWTHYALQWLPIIVIWAVFGFFWWKNMVRQKQVITLLAEIRDRLPDKGPWS